MKSVCKSDLELEELWNKLHKQIISDPNPKQRTYQRLALKYEEGVRVSCLASAGVWELLVEFDYGKNEMQFPKWKGMSFTYLPLAVPAADTKHLSITLEDESCKDIFVSVCTDLVLSIDKENSQLSREQVASKCIQRWTAFFDQYGYSVLSLKRQVGLYAELSFMKMAIEKGVSSNSVLEAWVGCEGARHDFSFQDISIEVKGTLTKEPKKVQISSEVQLNDSGLASLFLFVQSLFVHENSGTRISSLVQELSHLFSKVEKAKFQKKLQKAGYLDVHSSEYTKGFSVEKENFYLVEGDGFPRITSPPSGVGDVKYSLFLSVCDPYKKDADEVICKLLRTV